MVHRNVKLPSHLYLSSPSPPSNPSSTSTYFPLSSRSFASPSTLFNETSNSAIAASHHIPGVRTSAAFLNSLRANLHLATSLEPFPPSPSSSNTHLPLYSSPSTPADSPTNTPDCLRPRHAPPITISSSTTKATELSPHHRSDQPFNHPPAIKIPSITTSLATTVPEKTAASTLIAGSVAQQRHLAAQALIFHPAVLALYIAVLAAIYRAFYNSRSGHLAIALAAAMTMAGLLAVRWLVSGYLEMASHVGTWEWLDGNGGASAVHGVNEVVIAMFGKAVIGTVVVSGVRDADSISGNGMGGRGRHASNGAGSGGNGGRNGRTRGTIRAWTVAQNYRRKGVGGALLEETVKLCREKGWSGPVFADDHANSGRVLPKMFNAGFDGREAKARQMLDSYVVDLNRSVRGGHGGHGARKWKWKWESQKKGRKMISDEKREHVGGGWRLIH